MGFIYWNEIYIYVEFCMLVIMYVFGFLYVHAVNLSNVEVFSPSLAK